MTKYHNCYVNIDATDIKQLNDAIKEESISGKGPFVASYEKELCNYFKSPYALSCCNATAGIHMILLLEKIGPGDEVILPPTAPVMSVLPILAVGATPVFVDNEKDSFRVSITDLKLKISERTRLLINVPMWGYANNINELTEVCSASGIRVLEDNSHCHGTMLHGQHLGTFGDYSVYSTHERKLIATGEGGFLLMKNQSDYERLSEIRSFGEVARSETSYKDLKGAYGHFFGLNFKLSSINAALGISQIHKLNDKISQRRKNAAYLSSRISEINPQITEISSVPESDPNYYSIVFLTTPEKKIQIENDLLENGILSDPLRYRYQPLYKMPLFQPYASSCPNAEALTASVFTLPVHEGLIQQDLDLFLDLLLTVKHV